MNLFGTFKRLLNEVAARDQIIDAIKNRTIIIIYYDGDMPGGKGYREIEPVCLGERRRSDGTTSTLLRAWDIFGASHSETMGEQVLPGWRLFNINKITSWQKTTDTFDEPRPGYNFNGDRTMTRVIINAKFGHGGPKPPPANNNPNLPPPIEPGTPPNAPQNNNVPPANSTLKPKQEPAKKPLVYVQKPAPRTQIPSSY